MEYACFTFSSMIMRQKVDALHPSYGVTIHGSIVPESRGEGGACDRHHLTRAPPIFLRRVIRTESFNLYSHNITGIRQGYFVKSTTCNAVSFSYSQNMFYSTLKQMKLSLVRMSDATMPGRNQLRLRRRRDVRWCRPTVVVVAARSSTVAA